MGRRSLRSTVEEGIARTVEWYKETAPSGIFKPIESLIQQNKSKEPNSNTEMTARQQSYPQKATTGNTSLKKSFRHASDLELSSYVQKAPLQIINRKERILESSILDNCLTDFLDKSKVLGHHQTKRT